MGVERGQPKLVYYRQTGKWLGEFIDVESSPSFLVLQPHVV
ncbi:hypothetical protein [Streptomyces sp. NPDC005283]